MPVIKPPRTVWSEIESNLNDDEKRSYLSKAIYSLFGWEKQRLERLCKEMISELNKWEEQGTIRYNDTTCEKAQQYATRFSLYTKSCKKLLKKVTDITSKTLDSVKAELERKVVAFNYRAGSKMYGYDEGDYSNDNYTMLINWAGEWKKSRNRSEKLNELEILQLKEASKYGHFIPLIKNDKKYRGEFFRWALDNHNPVKVFIVYPLTRQRLSEAILSSAIGVNRKVELDGTVTNEILKTVLEDCDEGKREILTLPVFQGATPRESSSIKRFNILKPEGKILFNKIEKTVKEILTECSKMNEREVDFNFGAYGLCAGNPKDYYYDALKNGILVDDYYNDFMPTEFVDKDYLIKLYGKQDAIIDGKIFFRLAGSYKGKGLGDTHGWLQIFVPEGDKFKVIDYGKFAKDYVSGLWAKYLAVAGTNECVYIPFDQNGRMTQRRVTTEAIFTTAEETKRILDKIKKQMQEVGVFQFATDQNCAANAELLVKSSLEDGHAAKNAQFFETELYEGNLGFLESYFKSLKDRHWVIQYLGIGIVMILFAAWRTFGKVKNSVWDYYMDKAWKGEPIYLYGPALLAERTNLSHTYTYFGNTERKLLA